jgi:hypothetical protein
VSRKSRKAAAAAESTPHGADLEDLVAVVDSPTTQLPGVRASMTRRLVWFIDHVAPWIDRLVGHGARWAHLPEGRRVLVGWIVTHAVMLLILLWPESTLVSDVTYYFKNFNDLPAGAPLTDALNEYPLPVVWLLGIPWLLSFGSSPVFVTLFIAMMLAFDAMFCLLLYRRAGRTQSPAVTLWLASAPMMGPLMVTRFDVVPGILAGSAVLLLERKPRLATVLVAVGAAIKLWPAVLLPALAAPLRTRWRVVATSVVSGLVVAGSVVAVGGLDRLLSPLTWQSERGLQIESLPALPLMVPWALVKEPWLNEFGRFISSEVSGPGDSLMLKAASIATVLVGLAMCSLWWRAWRRGATVGAETVGWIMLTSTGLLILTNKAFSPQYLLWLSPVAIAMVAVAPRGDTGVRRFAVLLLTVGVLTQVIYPNAYALVAGPNLFNPVGVLLLAIRDVALIGFVVYAWRRAWNETSAEAALADAP